MLDLTYISDSDVSAHIEKYLAKEAPDTPRWRILSSVLLLAKHFSFSDNRTYPRPDHPDPEKRKPLIFMLAAILISLRTTLENEQKAVLALIRRYPTENDLFGAQVHELKDVIHVAGMPERRAKTIRRALDYVELQFGGHLETLLEMKTGLAREALLKIPGVGPKSADCLLSIGLGKPSIAVDVNVFRVTSWLFRLHSEVPINYNDSEAVSAVKRLLDANIPRDPFACQIVHTLFLLYGKKSGRNHPSYGNCILADMCLTCLAEQQQLALPLSR